jgi:hypothetical protein
MGSKKLRNTGALKVVQGLLTLADTIEVLREEVKVGEIPLKDLTEAQLEVLWTNKIGNENFTEAVRREVVHRIDKMFTIGIERSKKALSKTPMHTAMQTALNPAKVLRDVYNDEVDEKSFKDWEEFLGQEIEPPKDAE